MMWTLKLIIKITKLCGFSLLYWMIFLTWYLQSNLKSNSMSIKKKNHSINVKLLIKTSNRKKLNKVCQWYAKICPPCYDDSIWTSRWFFSGLNYQYFYYLYYIVAVSWSTEFQEISNPLTNPVHLWFFIWKENNQWWKLLEWIGIWSTPCSPFSSSMSSMYLSSRTESPWIWPVKYPKILLEICWRFIPSDTK